MIVDKINSSIKYMQLSLMLIADSETGGQMPKREEVQEKIVASKKRRIPVGKLLLVFVVIVMTIVMLEYFI